MLHIIFPIDKQRWICSFGQQIVKIAHGIGSRNNADDPAAFHHRKAADVMFYHQTGSLWIDRKALTFGFKLLGSTATALGYRIFAVSTEAAASKSVPL